MTTSTSQAALTRTAISATLHCLTGCAIGEILGMVISTALGWHNVASIGLSIGLAFLFGYALTIRPVLASGVGLRRAIGVALAADTVSIAVMELVDNATIVVVPGALDAGLVDFLFWASLLGSLVIAFVITVPVNRWMIARGKGHAVVHEYHHGPAHAENAEATDRTDHAVHGAATDRADHRDHAGHGQAAPLGDHREHAGHGDTATPGSQDERAGRR
jgi:hypothetical protein